MPCGGIWTPEPGSYWLAHKCWVCGEMGCELFCDEWDTPLHVRCLGKFLETDEGRCMLLHGHGITVADREDGTGWPGVTIDYPPTMIDIRRPNETVLTCPNCHIRRALLTTDAADLLGTIRCRKCGVDLVEEPR